MNSQYDLIEEEETHLCTLCGQEVTDFEARWRRDPSVEFSDRYEVYCEYCDEKLEKVPQLRRIK